VHASATRRYGRSRVLNARIAHIACERARKQPHEKLA